MLVQLGPQLLQVLLYADDLTLLASSPEELQAMLDALHEFSALNSLKVNVAKCSVVVFGGTAPPAGAGSPRRRLDVCRPTGPPDA